MTLRPDTSDAAPDDATTVAMQLGREPRGAWRVDARCSYGHPTVIETAPALPGGEPFPTLYYLTCPWLVEHVGALESRGEVARYSRELAADPLLVERMRAADAEYRARRGRAAGGVDPTPGVGIAGQRDPLGTKCLHAHVASALAGIDDPVGVAIVERVGSHCPDDRCAAWIEEGRS